MGQLVDGMQNKLRQGSGSLFIFMIRLLSAACVGLVLTLIGQVLLNYGNISYWFVFFIGLLIYFKITKAWGLGKIAVFNLILILTGLLLRMYIVLAPGA